MCKNAIYITLVMLVTTVFTVKAQETKDSIPSDQKKYQLEQLKIERENIIVSEKEKLKKEVQQIDALVEEGAITPEEGQERKEAAAALSARNIENKTAIVDNKIALLERGEKYDFEIHQGTHISMEDDEDFFETYVFNWDHWSDEKKYDRRTYFDLVIAFGFNNAIISGESFNDTPYKVGGSRFFEFGVQWKTRVFRNSNALRVSYGLAIQQNGLKPDDNQYFVKDGDLTTLETFPESLDKSKLRMDNIVIPVYLEFGPSRKMEYEDYFRYSTRRQFRIGIGGYIGLNYTTRQKLKYKEDGDRVKQKLKNNYNTNNTIYGLAGYIGFGDTSLYVKYDLNPIFKDPNFDQNNISLGLRFEL